jgi:hypothetical protein
MTCFGIRLVILLAAAAWVAPAATAQTNGPPDAETAQQIANLVRDRPPQAEMAARAAIYNFAPGYFGARGDEAAPPREPPLIIIDGVRQPGSTGAIPVPVLDRLKNADADAYWREVAMLTMQFEMFRRVVSRDTMRAGAMRAMFGNEFEARIIQRAWRGATEAQRGTLRGQLETLMSQHFDTENQLRALELRDIQRRLTDAQAEFQRRQQRKAELVRWSVEDIIHGAERPE